MSARRPLSFFTSPYKGEGPPLLGQMTPSLTLPLSGGGNASREVDR
jgi:hypothetical protein